jgi:integrase
MLAKLPLTPKGIEALKPPPWGKRKLIYDALVPGLAVRVTDKGTKAFVLVARFPGSQNPTARSLGLVGRLTLEAARDRARDWLALIAQGRDPAQQAKQAEANTVKAVCEDWFARRGRGQRSAAQSRSRLERLVYPTLGSMPIGEVRRSDVVRLHDRLSENGGVIANRVVAMLGSIFSWYSVRNEDFRNPVIRGMTTAEQARDRVLTDDELRAVWSAAEGPFGALVRFLLLTAARRGEALELRWAEIDGATWTLPAARNKTGVELVRPLSQAALAILAAQPRKGEFVFSRSGSGALGGLTELKAKLDRDSGTAGWRLHDLRRSARSLMSRAGVSSDHAERCLGHVIGSIRGVYDRHSYRDEMLIAYEKLATLIAGIVDHKVAS